MSAGAVDGGNVKVYLDLDMSKFQAGLRKAQAHVAQFGAQVGAAGRELAKIGAFITAPFVAGGAAAASFETSMARVQTMLSDTENAAEMFGSAIEDLSKEFGTSTKVLADGLYEILSASVDSSQAIQVLATAGRAAVGGFTDVKTAADAITTVLNSYGLAATEAARVTDILFTIQKRGKTSFGQLAPVIGRVTSIAKTSGVRLEEVAGFLSLLTRNGIQTEEAITSLRAAVATFLKPTKEAKEAAKALGIDLSTAGIQSKGFLGVLREISKLPADTITRLFPNIRAIAGLAPLLDQFEEFEKDVAAAENAAGSLETAYSIMANTIEQEIASLRQTVILAFKAIGTAILGPVSGVIKIIKPVVEAFTEWAKQNQQLLKTLALVGAGLLGLGTSLIALGAAINIAAFSLGGLAAAAGAFKVVLGALAAAAGFFLTPMGALIGVLGTFAAVLLQASGVAGAAVDYMVGKFAMLKDFAVSTFGAIADALAAGNIDLAAEVLFSSLQVIFATGVNKLNTYWETVYLVAAQAFDRVAFAVSDALDVAWTAVRNAATSMWKLFNQVAMAISDAFWTSVRGIVDAFAWVQDKVTTAKYEVGLIDDDDLIKAKQYTDSLRQGAKDLQREGFQGADEVYGKEIEEAEKRIASRRQDLNDRIQQRREQLEQSLQERDRAFTSDLAGSQADLKAAEDRFQKAKDDAAKAAKAGEAEEEKDRGGGALENIRKAIEGIGGAFEEGAMKAATITKGAFGADERVLGEVAIGVLEEEDTSTAESTEENTRKTAEELAALNKKLKNAQPLTFGG